MAGRRGVIFGVAHDHLIMDGAESDPDHPVTRELARRLHRHQLATVVIRAGVQESELADLIQALASESWRQGKPLGVEPPELLGVRWPSIQVEALPLAQLELGDGGLEVRPAEQRVSRLWDGLVHAALTPSSESPTAGGGARPAEVQTVSGADLAKAVRTRSRDGGYCRSIMEWLAQLGEQLEGVESAPEVHDRVAELFQQLDPDSLDNLLALGATAEERRDLIFHGARSLPVKAVLDLLQAVARTSNQHLSHTLLRLLTKLAGHVEGGGGGIIPDAEEVLRDSVRQLVGSWAGDAEIMPHRQLLDLLAKPVANAGAPTGRATASSLRVVQLGLEIGVHTPAVAAASRNVAEGLPLVEFMALVAQAEAGGLDASRLLAWAADQDALRTRLLDDAIPMDLIEELLDRIGDSALAPLLDALELSESASRRKAIIQRLGAQGPELGPIVIERLANKPWFVQRNLLVLVGSLPAAPAGFSAAEYARNPDHRVRREAFKLMLGRPVERGAAILAAAADVDSGIVLMALLAAGDAPPPELISRLPGLLSSGYVDSEVRSAAIRLLGARPTAAGRDWLLAQVVVQKGWLWFRRESLRAGSPETLLALGVLARSFSRHTGVELALRLASRSGDPEIRAAVQVNVP